MYVPVDAGAILLRDPTAERDAFSLLPPYLRTNDDFAGVAGPVDDLNRAILREVQLGGQAFVAGTTVRGAFALRACIVNPGATTADVVELANAVRDAGVRLLA
jgi:hypothetical protein